MDSTTGKLDIVLNASADKVNQEVDKVNAKLDQMMAKAQASSQRFVSANASSAQSMGGVATGIQRNVEAIDRLGQKTDQILGKQHTAWLAIGAVAGGTIQEVIGKVTGLVDKLNSIPDAIEAGFKPLVQSQYLANDRMELTNATLANQIALLEKKPENNAAVALAVAKIAADDLASSLDAANTKIEEVLSKNHISALRELLGKGPTANVEGTIKAFDDKIADLAYQREAALHSGDTAGAARLDKERRDTLATEHATLSRMMPAPAPTDGVMGAVQKISDKLGIHLDYSTSQEMLKNADSHVMAQQTADTQHDTNVAAEAQLKRDQDKQRAEEEAKAAAAAAKAAREQEYRDQMAGFEQQLANLRRNHELITGEETLFWKRMQAQTKDGSLAWLDINKRIGADEQRDMKDRREQSARDAEEGLKAMQEGERGMADVRRDQARAQSEHLDASNELAASQARIAATLAELNVEEVVGRTMTKVAAATQLATIHTQEYGAELSRLQGKLQAVASDSTLNGHEADRQKQVDELQKQIVELKAGRAVQIQQDAYRVSPPDSTASTGYKDALNDFVNATRDAAAMVKTITENTLNSLNKTLVDDVTGQRKRGEWAGLGKSVASDVAGSAIKKGEGALLSLFHYGSKTSPAHVFVENFPSATAPGSSALGGLLTMPGMPDVVSSAASSAGIGSGVSSAVSKILPFLVPGFADGVSSFGGGWAMVGERGPELVNLPGGSSVTPNSKMPSFGSGDIHFHPGAIDARCATDPAAVDAAVQRGILSAAPHIVAASIKANDSRNSRMAPTGRK